MYKLCHGIQGQAQSWVPGTHSASGLRFHYYSPALSHSSSAAISLPHLSCSRLPGLYTCLPNRKWLVTTVWFYLLCLNYSHIDTEISQANFKFSQMRMITPALARCSLLIQSTTSMGMMSYVTKRATKSRSAVTMWIGVNGRSPK